MAGLASSNGLRSGAAFGGLLIGARLYKIDIFVSFLFEAVGSQGLKSLQEGFSDQGRLWRPTDWIPGVWKGP